MLTFPIYDSQKINYEETLAQFYFYQLFNYNFMQFCVLVYVCGYIWWFCVQDNRIKHFCFDSVFISLLRSIVIYHCLYSLLSFLLLFLLL